MEKYGRSRIDGKATYAVGLFALRLFGSSLTLFGTKGATIPNAAYGSAT
ncbi:hypothetical protein [uncultured Treponema sp.]|nr:hypothetical protein [uncultured Treponema sp.]